jgi:hypothetical protein
MLALVEVIVCLRVNPELGLGSPNIAAGVVEALEGTGKTD